MAKRVFISKNASETSPLKVLLRESNIEFISHSFLDFKQVDFDTGQSTEIIFFGSPRAVEYFTNKVTIAPNVKIASIGLKTTQALEQLGYRVDFTGSSSDSAVVAKDFKDWAGSRTILFPLSNISLKTVVSAFGKEQIKEIIIYETIINSGVIQPCDVYVFTSPSNFRGFRTLNELPENAKIIAWGTSTAKELAKHKIQVDHILSAPTTTTLADVLKDF